MKSLQELIYLAGCIVNDVTPDRERVQAMDTDAVFALGRMHSLLTVVYAAVERALGSLEDAKWQRWKDKNQIAVCRSMMVNEELNRVTDFMEQAGIWYMPLKGAVLQTMYPSPAMRQMSDCDLLFDTTCRSKLRRWFVANGYKADSYRISYHDRYTKKPFFTFEMHKSLIEYVHGTSWAAYYENVKTRLLPDEGRNYGYHFSDEDFYVYLLTHGCKHYSKAGTGIRLLLDCYVFLRQKGTGMNWTYINQELATLGIAWFEERVRRLSMRLFGAAEAVDLSQEDSDLLRSFAEGGTYGRLNIRIDHALRGHGMRAKMKYAWRRLFPDARLFEYSYPFFRRHKWLLPVGYVYRIVNRSIVNRRHLASEIQALMRL